MITPLTWEPVVAYEDIHYEHSATGIAKVTIDRQGVRNAFRPETVAELIDAFARLNVLDLQRQIRSLPIPVIALVNGFAIGGGQVLHVVCDLSIAADTAVF